MEKADDEPVFVIEASEVRSHAGLLEEVNGVHVDGGVVERRPHRICHGRVCGGNRSKNPKKITLY